MLSRGVRAGSEIVGFSGGLCSFLYETRTIQQTYRRCSKQGGLSCSTSLHPRKASTFTAVRNDLSAIKPSNEALRTEQGQDMIEDVGDEKPSTMTGKERAAFAALLKLQGKKKSDGASLKGAMKAQKPKKPTKGDQKASAASKKLPKEKPAHELKLTEDGFVRPDPESSQNAMDTVELPRDERMDKLLQVREKERQRISHMLQSARTDVELWRILEKEIFNVLKGLKLDNPAVRKSAGSRSMEDKLKIPVGAQKEQKPDAQSTSEGKGKQPATGKTAFSPLESSAPVFPSLLTLAARTYRVHFPSSTLILGILPTLKRIGPSAYTLGASTSLFNEVILATWRAFYDFEAVANLLREMDNGGFDYDDGTMRSLGGILQESEKIIHEGKMGVYAQGVWQTERMSKLIKELQDWDQRIRGEMQAQALQQAKLVEAENQRIRL